MRMRKEIARGIEKMLIVNLSNEQNIKISEQITSLLKAACEAVLKNEEFNDDAEINITLVSDERIRELNSAFRNIDKSTDVLSFPQYEFDEEGDVSHITDGVLILGDVIISLEHAKAQSLEFNHSLNREVGYLTAHSMLHLLGYDHMEDDEKARMRQKEEQIMTNIKLTRED